MIPEDQNIKIHQYDVSDKMLQYYSQARAKYNQYLISGQDGRKKRVRKIRKSSDEEEKYQVEKEKTMGDEANSLVKEADKKAYESLNNMILIFWLNQSLYGKKGQRMLKKKVPKQSDNGCVS